MVFLLIIGGRQIRTKMLLDDQGHWREGMWLDELVLPSQANAAGKAFQAAKPKLTSPLPINSCSLDSLTLLPGVGKVMAERIDEARRQGRIFTCADDLRLVKGIGIKLSARLDTLVIYQLELPPVNLLPDSTFLYDCP